MSYYYYYYYYYYYHRWTFPQLSTGTYQRRDQRKVPKHPTSTRKVNDVVDQQGVGWRSLRFGDLRQTCHSGSGADQRFIGLVSGFYVITCRIHGHVICWRDVRVSLRAYEQCLRSDIFFSVVINVSTLTCTSSVSLQCKYLFTTDEFQHNFVISISTRPLQFFCNTLPISFLVDQRKLIFWYRMHCSNNPILYAPSRLHQNRFIAIGCKYGIDLLTNSCVYVKEAVWRVFAGTVTL